MTVSFQVQDSLVQFSSVPQSFPALCNSMNRRTPRLPVHHQLPEFTQTHVHRVSDAIQPSHPLSSPSPPAPNPSQHQGLFQWVNSSHEVAKVLKFQLQHQSLQRVKQKKSVEIMRSQSSLQRLNADNKDEICYHREGCAGSLEVSKKGQTKTLQGCYQRHSVTQYLYQVTFNVLFLLRVQDSMISLLECKTSGLG